MNLKEFKEIKTDRKITSTRFYIKRNELKTIGNRKTIKTINSKSIQEIVINESEEDSIYYEIIDKVKVIYGEKISLKNAKEFYSLASNHELGKTYPLDFIGELAEYSKTQNVKGFIGWFKRMLVNYEKPIKSNKQLKFEI